MLVFQENKVQTRDLEKNVCLYICVRDMGLYSDSDRQ